MKSLYSFILLLIISSITLNAQEYGKIYSADEANILFGDVLHVTKINKDDLMNLSKASTDVMLFQFISNECYIFNETKTKVFGEERSITTPQTFYVYSTSKVKELIEKADSDMLYLEKRERHLTISGGNYTLEKAVDCPPFCN